MKSSRILIASLAAFSVMGGSVAMADDYDCGTEQAAIRKRAKELSDDVDAKKVTDQNSCAYLEAAAQQAERQAAFILNCYKELNLTEQKAEDGALVFGVSAKKLRQRCAQTK